MPALELLAPAIALLLRLFSPADILPEAPVDIQVSLGAGPVLSYRAVPDRDAVEVFGPVEEDLTGPASELRAVLEVSRYFGARYVTYPVSREPASGAVDSGALVFDLGPVLRELPRNLEGAVVAFQGESVLSGWTLQVRDDAAYLSGPSILLVYERP